MKTITRKTRTVAFPAPKTECVELGNGQFYHRPWTMSGVTDALSAGMWFEPTGRHSFATSAAKKVALDHFFRLPRDQFGRIVR